MQATAVFPHKAPLLIWLIPHIAGILLAVYFPQATPSTLLVASISILLFLTWRLLPINFRRKHAYIKGIGLQVILCSAAYLYCAFITLRAEQSQQFLNDNQSVLKVYLCESPEQKPKTRKVEAELIEVYTHHQKIKAKARIILYFQQGKKADSLQEGQILFIKNQLQRLKESGNPGSFSYRQYCHYRGIYYSGYLQEAQWHASGQHIQGLEFYFHQLNWHTRNVLYRYLPHADFALAEALLLGYRKNIDAETWQSYADTGIAHIIAISGMHMAMVYLSIRWLLLLLPWAQRYKRVAIGIALLMMWLFACVTGLPPSVSRAAFMFTLLGIGEIIDKNIPPSNNLAASALLLLWINPYWLFDIGFQLSFLAVLSLQLTYTSIYAWYKGKNKYISSVWKLIAATLSAQVFTLPLCLFAFHQFPLLFLLGNLIAVPLSSILLYLEILLIACSPCQPLAQQIASLIYLGMQGLNHWVDYLHHISFSVWQVHSFSIAETILLYALIICIVISLQQRKLFWLNAGFLLASLLCLINIRQCIQTQRQQYLLVYQSPKKSVIEFMMGSSYTTSGSTGIPTDKALQQYILKPAHQLYNGWYKDSTIVASHQTKQYTVYTFSRQRILQLRDTTQITIKAPIPVDFLILSHPIRITNPWLLTHLQPKQIILDSSIPGYRCAQLRQQLSALQVPIHSVTEQGAFIYAIPTKQILH